MDWNIGRKGQGWTGAEGLRKLDLMPGRLELVHGKLCFDEAERRTLLAGLLENVGIDEVLGFGDIRDWREAIAARMHSENSVSADVAQPTPSSHWNCRVIASEHDDGETWFEVHEVYYVNGLPRSRAETPSSICWSSEDGTDGGERRLEQLREALRKPPLTDADLRR